jgi:hypothetical protein
MESVISEGQMDLVSLKEEENVLERVIKNNLYTSDDERLIEEYHSDLILLLEAHDLKLAPWKKEIFDERKKHMTADKWIDFIEEYAKKHKIKVICQRRSDIVFFLAV